MDCPACGFRFNYLYTLFGSLHAIRLLDRRSFRCPRCHARHAFALGTSAPDRSVPTYDDRFTPALFFAASGPLLAGVALSLLAAGSGFARWLTVVPIAVGVAWLVVFGLVNIARGEIPLASPGSTG